MTENGMIMVRCKHFLIIDNNESGQCMGFREDADCPLGRRFSLCNGQMVDWVDFIKFKKYFIEIKDI